MSCHNTSAASNFPIGVMGCNNPNRSTFDMNLNQKAQNSLKDDFLMSEIPNAELYSNINIYPGKRTAYDQRVMNEAKKYEPSDFLMNEIPNAELYRNMPRSKERFCACPSISSGGGTGNRSLAFDDTYLPASYFIKYGWTQK